jgi:hypothetical protein
VAVAKLCEPHWRQVLLGKHTSKCNKAHIVAGLIDRGYWLEWEWNRFSDPISFKFEPDAQWEKSRCLDDVIAKMKDHAEKKGSK